MPSVGQRGGGNELREKQAGQRRQSETPVTTLSVSPVHIGNGVALAAPRKAASSTMVVVQDDTEWAGFGKC